MKHSPFLNWRTVHHGELFKASLGIHPASLRRRIAIVDSLIGASRRPPRPHGHREIARQRAGLLADCIDEGAKIAFDHPQAAVRRFQVRFQWWIRDRRLSAGMDQESGPSICCSHGGIAPGRLQPDRACIAIYHRVVGCTWSGSMNDRHPIGPGWRVTIGESSDPVWILFRCGCFAIRPAENWPGPVEN